MSQFYIQTSGGVGPIPPTVPTNFTTDFGSVTPANNNVNVLGHPTAANQQGIITQAVTQNSPNDTIFVRYISNAVTTLNGATTIALTVIIPDNTSFTAEAVISAFCPGTGDAFGGRMTCIGVNLAGIVSVLTEIENVSSGSNVLNNCHINFDGQGNTLAVAITGIAQQVDWKVLIPVIAIV